VYFRNLLKTIGLKVMRFKIQWCYYVPKLVEWLRKSKSECRSCQLTIKPKIAPPMAVMLPTKPNAAWQIDHIGKFPSDSKTGDR
jgi:hypothetical protein